VAGYVVLAIACIASSPPQSVGAQLRLHPDAVASASSELLGRWRVDPFTYFRFINRAWTERLCKMFADVPDVPIVRLHWVRGSSSPCGNRRWRQPGDSRAE